LFCSRCGASTSPGITCLNCGAPGRNFPIVPQAPAATATSNDNASGRTPPAVWLAAVILCGVGVFLLDPVVRLGGATLSHVFDANAFVRAFSTVALEVVAVLAISGIALILLGIGLVKGSRSAQMLTCLLSAVVAVSQIIAWKSASTEALGSVTSKTDAIVTSVIALVIVMLLLWPPAVRRYFANDARPLGVEIAVAANLYLGSVALCNGVLLMLAGALGKTLVWIGVGFAAAGLLLLAANRYLRGGRSAARAFTIVFDLAVAGLAVTAAVDLHLGVDAATLIPALIAGSAVVGVCMPQSSRSLFAEPVALPSRSPIAIIAWALTAAAVGGAGTVGVLAAYKPFGSYRPAAESVPITTPSPDVYTPPATSLSSLSDQDAYRVGDEVLSAMSTGSYAPTCNGSPPSEPVATYSIDQVTPQTSGDYAVYATVTLDDGSTDTVYFIVTTSAGGETCADASTITFTQTAQSSTNAPSPQAAKPEDVPSLPSYGERIPRDASPPGPPQAVGVIAYTRHAVPSTPSQLLEWQPSGLAGAEQLAVRNVIGFMTEINRQNMGAAWRLSTERLSGHHPTAAFADGYRTSRFYQVAFGQPRRVAPDLIVVPGRFVSRQNPAAQGYPAGVTGCSYWPQYVFVVARVDGQWLLDVANRYVDRGSLTPFKRFSDGQLLLNPVSQRAAC
jgi:hypothetical protein